MTIIKEKDINKFLYYLLSNEKQQIKDNPFNNELDRQKLRSNVKHFLEETCQKIIGESEKWR